MNKRTKKSALTQQQRNNKRQRAKSSQLDVLRREYQICPTPDAMTRRRIGAMIDMTERSVQIWFQNTRAKQKKAMRANLNKNDLFDESFYESEGSSMSPNNIYTSSQLHGLGIDSSNLFGDNSTDALNTPVSQRHVLCTPPLSVHQYGESRAVPASPSPRSSLPSLSPSLTPLTSYGDNPIFFPTLSLTIGNWKRLSPQLSLAYYPETDSMSYHFTSNAIQFRMQFPFSSINEIYVSHSPSDTMGTLNLCLSYSPSFSIITPKSPDTWITCHDFSQNKQASSILRHICLGPATVLQQQLSRVFEVRRTDKVRCLTPPSAEVLESSVVPDQSNTRFDNVSNMGQLLTTSANFTTPDFPASDTTSVNSVDTINSVDSVNSINSANSIYSLNSVSSLNSLSSANSLAHPLTSVNSLDIPAFTYSPFPPTLDYIDFYSH